MRITDQKDQEVLNTLLDRFLNKRRLLLNWNEFNEILLLCNKDRMSEGFYEFFFSQSTKKKKLSLEEIDAGVGKFRHFAMLAYGNFIFAYQELSKLSDKEIINKLKDYLVQPAILEQQFSDRPTALERIYPVKRDHTHFVGYLSSKNIEIEWDSARTLKHFFDNWKGAENKFVKDLLAYLNFNKVKEAVKDYIKQIVSKFCKINSVGYNVPDISRFKKLIYGSIEPLRKIKEKYEKVRKDAELNTDIYLTWDYIDVYLATSMREKYDYESFYDFTKELFDNKCLKKLKLRYFDPTQSFEKNRIDKGLIEGLMLKRAKCTIYSVQESDTLGKDSELASTLAQGKPVIAYIPAIDIKKHAKFIKNQSLSFLLNKIDLLCAEFKKPETLTKLKDWALKSHVKSDRIDINNPASFRKFIFEISEKVLNKAARIWESIEPSDAELTKIKLALGVDFDILCSFIATADKAFYDRRAFILQETHPLGIQINLSTGVANGVLIVRTVNECARLLYGILTNKVIFTEQHNSEFNYDYLRENISDSIFRVVTNDLRLTNSFWNFYLLKEEGNNA